jgi:WD40 repeat protein
MIFCGVDQRVANKRFYQPQTHVADSLINRGSRAGATVRVVVPLASLLLLSVSGLSSAITRTPFESGTASTDLFGDPLPPGALARLGTVRFRQGDPITALAFSPDGATLVSGGEDGTLRFWDTATGKMITRWHGENTSIDFIAFSRDGQLLAAGSPATSIGLREPATGNVIRRFGSWLGTGCVDFSPRANLIASSGGDSIVHLWETATGRQLGQLVGHKGAVFAARFSPDGKLLASAGKDKTVRLWDVAALRELHRCTGHSVEIRSLAFSPDGQTLASMEASPLAFSGTRLWEVATGREIRCLEPGLAGVSFSGDGKRLTGVDRTGKVQLWDLATGKQLRHFPSERLKLGQAAFDSKGQILATGAGNSIRLWDVATGKEMRPAVGAHHAPVFGVALDGAGRTVVSAAEEETVGLWEIRSGSSLAQLGSRVQAFALSSDSQMLALCETRPTIELWNLAARKKVGQLQGHEDPVFSMAFSPGGKTLVSAAADDSIRTWGVAACRQLRRFEHSNLNPNCSISLVRYTPDGMLALVCRTGVYLFPATADGSPRQLAPRIDVPRAVAFAPDGNVLAASSRYKDRTTRRSFGLRLYDRATGQLLLEFARHQHARVTAIAYSPDGRTLVTGDSDHLVRLWEIASGKECGRFWGHDGEVLCVAFSEDGRTVVSGSSDTSLLVWDVTGRAHQAALDQTEFAQRQIELLWADLANKDAVRAFRAGWQLMAGSKRTVVLLREHLRPITAVGDAHIAELIQNLDSNSFIVRRRADEELARLGELAEPAMRKALLGRPGLEVCRRLEQRLQDLSGPETSLPRLQALRAVQVLERINSPESRRLLMELAAGTPQARLTREAKASLERLTRAATTP